MDMEDFIKLHGCIEAEREGCLMPFSLMGCTVQMYHMEQYGVRYLDSNLLPMLSIECCLLLLTEEDPLLLFVSFYAHKSEDPGWGEIIGPDLYPHWQ